jgi:hypothetical protein
MGATADQACQLAVLDRLAVLTDLDNDLQAVITRIANRALTDAEGDDVTLLIQCRGHLQRYRAIVAACHNDCRRTKP